MKQQTSLENRLAYLSLADFDYLSARILLLFGIAHTGFPKAAEAFEKLFKLYILLETKVNRNEETSYKELKKYEHKLVTLFKKIKPSIPAKFDSTWDEYFLFLQETYKKRYPEHWKSFKYDVDISKLDNSYLYLRNGIVRNFPAEEQDRTRQFGGFISDAYVEEIKKIVIKRTGRSLKDMLLQDNECIKNYDIDFNNL